MLLFFGCLLFHLVGTWSLPLIDRDEPRFAEASREMLERGDYVVPFFNNQYRFDKPPFTYWCQALSYRAFGENDFAARFPSAIAAAVAAVLLLAWGRRLASERTGWWAAIIFTLCLQTFVHAKAAVADMWLVLFVTAAHWAAYELLRDRIGARAERPTSNVQRSTFNEVDVRPSSAWWWLFYFALALAFLAKGPIGWTPLLTVIAMKLLFRDLRLADRIAPLSGMVLMFGIVALWATPALLRTHGDFFRVGIGHHVVERSLVTMEGHGGKSLGWYLLTLPFYFVSVFVSFFPWSIKLPWLTKRLRNQRDATDSYLIAGSAIIFLVFTLVKTKLPHYTLLAFPLLALLLARHWSRLESAATTSFLRIATATTCVWIAIALFVFPFARHYSPAIQLLEASQGDLRPEMEFGAVDYNEPSLVWYFRSRVRGFFHSALNPASVGAFMEKSGPRIVIAPTKLVEKIYPTLPTGWKRFSISGFNIAKGKHVDLTLILKPRDT